MISASLAQAIKLGKNRVLSVLESALPHFVDAYPCSVSRRTPATSELSQYIDHTLLKPTAKKADFEELCSQAMTHKMVAVCVPSNRLALSKSLLADSRVKLATVVGFPLGYALTEAKVAETKAALVYGADEIDMVIAQGLVKDGDILAVYLDIAAVLAAADGRPVKVILETSELTLEEKIDAAYIAAYAGASFLKTSTGFSQSGASLEDITLLRYIAGDLIGVKASGGVRTKEFASACIAAGADRLGTSSGLSILGLNPEKGQGY